MSSQRLAVGIGARGGPVNAFSNGGDDIVRREDVGGAKPRPTRAHSYVRKGAPGLAKPSAPPRPRDAPQAVDEKRRRQHGQKKVLAFYQLKKNDSMTVQLYM